MLKINTVYLLLKNCLLSILDDNIPEKYVIPVGFLSIRLIDKHSNVFNDMKSWFIRKYEKSIMDKISQKTFPNLNYGY